MEFIILIFWAFGRDFLGGWKGRVIIIRWNRLDYLVLLIEGYVNDLFLYSCIYWFINLLFKCFIIEKFFCFVSGKNF